MKRFLMLVGVAAIAGVMYVAAASGSQQSNGPSGKQFKALKLEVAALQKKVKSVQTEADGESAVILHCMLHSVFGVVQRSNYAIGDPVTGESSAIDLTASGAQYLVAGFNTDPVCMKFVGQAGLRHAASTFAQKP
jgi:hypothetical protein